MRKMLTSVLLLAFLAGGCAAPKNPAGYYNPERTFRQARQDWLECKYDAMKAVAEMQASIEMARRAKELRDTCMALRGYQWVRQSDLPPGWKMVEVDRRYYVACNNPESEQNPN